MCAITLRYFEDEMWERLSRVDGLQDFTQLAAAYAGIRQAQALNDIRSVLTAIGSSVEQSNGALHRIDATLQYISDRIDGIEDDDTSEATSPEATSPEATSPEATSPEATSPEATSPEATGPSFLDELVSSDDDMRDAGQPSLAGLFDEVMGKGKTSTLPKDAYGATEGCECPGCRNRRVCSLLPSR